MTYYQRVSKNKVKLYTDLHMVRKVANDVFNPEYAGFYLMSDGNVWYYSYSSGDNRGPLDEFIARVKAGQLRAKLIEVQP